MTTTALIANNLPVPSALGSLDAYGWSEVATYFWPTTDLAVF